MMFHGDMDGYPLVICYSLLLKMAIEIVDFPIKSMVIFQFVILVYQRVTFQNIQAEEAFQRYHGWI
jgi:hypothetical protein